MPGRGRPHPALELLLLEALGNAERQMRKKQSLVVQKTWMCSHIETGGHREGQKPDCRPRGEVSVHKLLSRAGYPGLLS